MPSEWEEISLDKALEINPSVKMERGKVYSFVDMQSVEAGYKFVEPQQKREFKGSGSRFIDGDTLMARITPCLENGKISKYRSKDDIPAHGSTEFIVMRHRKNVTHPEFVYYLVISDIVKAYAISQMTGSSGRQRVPVDSLKHLTIKLPSITEQKAIAQILKALDDKIELNRKMCKALEDAGSAIFKSWFVDFDPVRAKENEGELGDLSPDILSLFPNSFTDSKIGDLPTGWDISVVYDWAEYINGAAYKNMHFSEEPDALPVIKIAELKNGIGPGTKFTNTDLGDKYLLDTGDILFSWSGSPETSIDTFLWVDGKGWLNQHIFKVVPKGSGTRAFCYFLLKHLKPTFIHIAKNKQTTGLGHVTVKDLKELKVANPGKKLINAFDEVINPIFTRIQEILEQNAALAKTRDALLPQLMSGELRVEDVGEV
ncbi:MAG: restriction endonuclease subunit S [Micavibrio sp.]|nr:restriction endonuclease subunit S [Micavibrio sp.]|tara:strand:- start:2362 stop:3648 length:1287 start_codon:yes stop_codon:yes gene_type:complete